MQNPFQSTNWRLFYKINIRSIQNLRVIKIENQVFLNLIQQQLWLQIKRQNPQVSTSFPPSLISLSSFPHLTLPIYHSKISLNIRLSQNRKNFKIPLPSSQNLLILMSFISQPNSVFNYNKRNLSNLEIKN